MRQRVAEKAAESAITTWDGSLAEFLSDLDPGSKHDWVRAALWGADRRRWSGRRAQVIPLLLVRKRRSALAFTRKQKSQSRR